MYLRLIIIISPIDWVKLVTGRRALVEQLAKENLKLNSDKGRGFNGQSKRKQRRRKKKGRDRKKEFYSLNREL